MFSLAGGSALATSTITIINGSGGTLDAQLPTFTTSAPNSGGNTLSETALEGQSASTVTLLATGQITLSNLSDNLLDLSGSGAHSLSITSSNSGGVTFLDTNDEIRTGGGTLVITANGTGTLNLGKLTSTSDITLTGAQVTMNSAITAGTLAVHGSAILSSNVTTTAPSSNAQEFFNDVTLGAGITLSSTGIIIFHGPIDSDAVTNRSFTITMSDPALSTFFNGDIGATHPLASLTVTSPIFESLVSTIKTTGNQTYNNIIGIDGGTTSFISTAGGSITFGEITAIDSTRRLQNMVVNTTGNTAFNGTVSFVPGLEITSLNVSNAAGTVSISGGTVTSTGDQAYAGAMTLLAATTLDTIANGTITLAAVNGAQSLTISSAGTGQVTLGGAVGASTALTSLSVTAGQTINLNGGSVKTTGSQTYSSPITLGAATTLTSTANGPITLASVDGAQSFTLSSAGTGQVTLGGAIGATTALTSLSVTAGQAINLNGGSVKTTGGQTYSGPMTLGAATTLTSTANGTIGLAAINGAQNLTLSSAGTGQVTLGGAIGAGAALTSLSVTAGQAINLNGGSVKTTGAQTYSGSVILGGPTTLTNNTGNITFSGSVSDGVVGGEALVKMGGGTLLFSAANTFTGTMDIKGGLLQVDGSLANTSVTIENGATLGGKGSIAGSVTVASGGILAPGDSPGTLTVGSLVLNAGSISNYQLSTPSVIGSNINDLTMVTGNLTLGGTLNVADAGGFGPGSYQIFKYGGALTNNGLALGSVPSGYSTSNFIVATGVNHEVDLIVLANSGSATTQFWDGAGPANNGVTNGGSGAWTNFAANFSDSAGNNNAAWQNGVAVFAAPSSGATSSTVTLSGAINFAGLLFAGGGYTIASDGAAGTSFTALGPPTNSTNLASISVNPGVTATISAAIGGSAGITKDGTGTLVLTGTNTYSGGTKINGGILSINNSSALSGGGVRLATGTELNSTADSTLTNDVAFAANGTSTISAAAGTVLTLTTLEIGADAQFGSAGNTGTIVVGPLGSGSLASTATITVKYGVLRNGSASAGLGSFTSSIASTTINSGATLDLNDQALTVNNLQGAGSVTLGSNSNTTLKVNAGAFSGVISGSGALDKLTAGSLVLTGANTYSGGTTIGGGTLQIGDGSTIGSIVGDVANNGALIFKRSNSYTFDGAITGSGSVSQQGSGTVTLTHANGYGGGTSVSAGVLLVNNLTGSGTGSNSVTVGSATLGGTGTISGLVTLNSGGLIAPGTVGTVGTLTVGGLTLSTGSTYGVDLGSGANNADEIVVNGAVSLNGANITFNALSALNQGRYELLSATGALTGTFAGATPTGYELVYLTHEVDLVALGTIGSPIVGTPQSGTIITGGSTPFGFTVTNSAPSNGASIVVSATAGANTSGSAGPVTVNAQSTSGTVNGLSFTGSTVGAGQIGSFSVADSNATNSPQTGTVTVTVLDHATTNGFTGGTLALAPVHAGYATPVDSASTLLVQNGSPGDIRADLKGSASSSGNISLSSLSGVTAGSIGSITATLGAGRAAGVINQDFTYTFADDSTLSGASANLAQRTITVTGVVYTGLGVWNTNGNGSWSDFSKWTTLGGAPGLDSHFQIGDTATFSSGATSAAPLVTLDGANPSVSSIVFDNASKSYTVAQGFGGTLILDNGVNAATVQVANGNHIISAPLQASSDLQVMITNASDGLLVTGNISESGGARAFTKLGYGILALNGANTYSGGTAINAGVLLVNNASGSATGSGPVAVNNGAALGGGGAIAGAVTLHSGGLIAPGLGAAGRTLQAGSLTWNGNSMLSFQLGAASDKLALTGALTKGTAGIFDVNLVDAGGILNQLQYTLATFASQNGFTAADFTLSTSVPGLHGSFLLTGSELDFIISGIAASGPIIQNSAPVGTPKNADFVVNGPVTTGGPADNNQIHTLTFTSGSSLLIHNTLFVAQGPVTLVGGASITLDGALSASQLQMLPGSLLNGNGSIGGNLSNGGVVSPGNSPGQIQVTGNYSQTPTGLLRIELGGLDLKHHDLLSVGGAAQLGGTLQLARLNNFKLKRNDSITFLTASAGVSGKFDTVATDFTSDTILQPTVVYHRDSVALEAVQGSFEKFAKGSSLTPNQRSVARALDSVVFDKRTNSLIDYLDDRELTKLPGDFTKISPDALTSIFQIGASFANVQSLNLQRRAEDIRSGANGFGAAGLAMNGDNASYSGGMGFAGPAGSDGKDSKSILAPAPDNRWGAFLSGTGEWVKVGDTGNARGYDLQTGGFTLGLDYKVTPSLAIGISAGYAGTGVDLADGGRVFVNGGKFGVYGTYFTGGFYSDAAINGGYNSYATHRSALNGAARGNADGDEFNTLVAMGYDWKTAGFNFGPTAAFNYTNVRLNSFTERGSLAPLDIHGGNGESLRSAFGFRAGYDWKIGGVIIKPEIRAVWQHEFGDATYSLDSSFANGAGNIFTTTGPRIGRDSLLLSGGFAIQWSDRVSTYLYYDGELARTNYQVSSISGGFRLEF